MRTAYFDLIGGAAGDMLLGALVDAGAPVDALRDGLAGLRVEPFTLRVGRAQRGFLDACRVEVALEPAGDPPHRHLSDVLALLDQAGLPPRALARARAAFEALALAEGRVHGVDPEEVHFHEVGALDAIVDVAGTCLALELLGVDRVESAPLPVARGFTRAEHGVLPLPAPAVLFLAEAASAPLDGRPGQGELVTPTGAALLCALATRWGDYPTLALERTGYGAGARDPGPDAAPNVTRVVLGQAPAPGTPGEVVVVEATLDTDTPERLAWTAEALLGAGALDVWLTAVTGKKGRPAVVVTALCDPAGAGPVEDALLRESSSLGLRRRREARSTLPRELRAVETPFGPVRVKTATRPDGARTHAPEHDDCARLAREAGRPLREVYEAALRAAGP